MVQDPTPVESTAGLNLRSTWALLWEALVAPYSYNPLKNGYMWVGLLWGLPIPCLFLWFHASRDPAPPWELFLNHPVHWFFAAHPLLFGLIFGIVGSINQHYINRLKELSVRDSLTELYNHRFLRDDLRRQLQQARRYDRAASFILFDLDHFKRVNDRHGHLKGDEVLRELARLMKEETRDPDVVCRYGGEEFGIILPETPSGRAREFAERIRRMTEQQDFGLEEPLTLSGGIAGYPDDGETATELIQAADERLYRAKQNGRNRVVDSTDRSPSTDVDQAVS